MSVGIMALFVAALLLASRAVVQAAGGAASPLVAGDHDRTLLFGGARRTYRIHVPAGYDPAAFSVTARRSVH
jgi:poly(3-hydroxybutyrate) depolymerase